MAETKAGRAIRRRRQQLEREHNRPKRRSKYRRLTGVFIVRDDESRVSA